ncbi:hypothetical protein PGT21_000004, partial [Puccinia graminis f. sp. tritici]
SQVSWKRECSNRPSSLKWSKGRHRWTTVELVKRRQHPMAAWLPNPSRHHSLHNGRLPTSTLRRGVQPGCMKQAS